MIPIKSESAWKGTSNCRNCAVREVALFADLDEKDFALIHVPIDDLEFKPGSCIYDESDSAVGIYTLRTGMVKLVRVTADGRSRIVRILRPGDVIGLEALATTRYNSQAVALTQASVCRIPLDVIRRMGGSSQRLHANLMQKWQQALKEADDWLADLNSGSAIQRVVALIQKMRNPLDGKTCVLFSREDMGAMLNLKIETVSRQVSKLVQEGVIKAADRSSRTYVILKPEELRDRSH